MPCYYPLDGYRAKNPNERGKYPVVFDHKQAQTDFPVQIACGQCTGCRLERSRQWAMRCHYEASLHDQNCFITLTYDEENLPESTSLERQEWTKFMKAFRHKISPQKIRFYMCGEYGENQDITSLDTLGRPHFHAIIFGYQFDDLEPLEQNFQGDQLYTSKTLSDIWKKGFVTIGEANLKTAAYVARYILKKINGEETNDHYSRTNYQTGEKTFVHPEFTGCSMRPGIARQWFEKYRNDLDKGFLTINGTKMPPPKYFKNLYKENFETEYQFTELHQDLEATDAFDLENRSDRLRARETALQLKMKKVQRQL